MDHKYDFQLFEFSDELKTALRQYRESEIRLERYLDEFEQTIPHPEGKSDRRDLTEMIHLEPGKTPEEEKAYVREFILDLESGDPERKKKSLDQLFNKADAYDPRKLDLSCMSGRDGERREPGKLTGSERDFMKLVEDFRRGQAIPMKLRENPDYAADRYQSPAAREAVEMKHRYATVGATMYMTQVLMLNGFNQTLDSVVPYPILSSTDNAKAASVAAQRYDNYVTGLEHGAPDRKITFSLSPDQANLYGLDKQLAAGNVSPEIKMNAVDMFNSSLGAIYNDGDYQERLEAAGANQFDLIHINGKSAAELFGEKYKGLPDAEQERMMKAEIMGAVMSGKSHIDVVNIDRDAAGKLTAVTTPVHPDLHAYDRLEKQAEHGRLHRLLDWGPGRIRTRADMIDKMEKNLAGREPLTRERERRLNEKLAKFNESAKDTPAAGKREEKEAAAKKGISLSELEKGGKQAAWKSASAPKPLQSHPKLSGERGISGHRETSKTETKDRSRGIPGK